MTSKVLIVEDDSDFATSLELALGLVGIEAVVTKTAEEAFAMMHESPDEIRLGFFDVKLPQEDGISCYKRIREEIPGFVGVIMTGFRDDKISEQAKDAGAVEVLLKPFRMAQFMELAKQYTTGKE